MSYTYLEPSDLSVLLYDTVDVLNKSRFTHPAQVQPPLQQNCLNEEVYT